MDERIKVLIVDDNKELANALKDAIKNYSDKWTADAVYDGGSALNSMSLTAPDIVFCDIVLPDMSGLDVMRNIKDIEQDIQVIIMTAYASLSTAIEALQYGAFDYIPKPLHINQVINAIKSAEKRRRDLLENRRMITNLLSLKNVNKITDETREIIDRIVLLKQFQKKVALYDKKKNLLEICYKEFAKIFSTDLIYIFIKDDNGKFSANLGPKNGEFKTGDEIDVRMPQFYLPVKNGIGCIFTGEKSMTSVVGFENKIMGLIYFKRDREFLHTELETAEVLAIEIGAKLTEITLNKKIDSDRMGIIFAFMTFLGLSDIDQKKRVNKISKLCVDFSEFISLPSDEVEKIRYASMLYNYLEISADKKNKRKTEITQKIDEIMDEVTFINNSRDIIGSIGENYDGSGKPNGLKRDEIPEGSRIIKIATTYSLLIDGNVYRSGEEELRALESMQEKSGIYFDPALIFKFIDFINSKKGNRI